MQSRFGLNPHRIQPGTPMEFNDLRGKICAVESQALRSAGKRPSPPNPQFTYCVTVSAPSRSQKGSRACGRYSTFRTGEYLAELPRRSPFRLSFLTPIPPAPCRPGKPILVHPLITRAQTLFRRTHGMPIGREAADRLRCWLYEIKLDGYRMIAVRWHSTPRANLTLI